MEPKFLGLRIEPRPPAVLRSALLVLENGRVVLLLGRKLKSAFADLPNIGTRYGGAVTAALFLKEFAEETPWIHLDIAGTAWLGEAKPYLAKGPTGVAVRTLIRLAMDFKPV